VFVEACSGAARLTKDLRMDSTEEQSRLGRTGSR
jgi:hypothetical protein